MNNLGVWEWVVFAGLVALMLTVDLVAHRGGRASSGRAVLAWSIVWVATGLLFAVFVWLTLGGEPGREYLGAYLIEKSLSLDNLFVFLVIFQSLGIPWRRQHTVLFWGIFGALVFRAAFIFVGVEAIERWSWISYIFGAILLFAAYRSLREDPAQKGESRVVSWLSARLPVTREVHGDRFLVRLDGERRITPLLVALIALELTDILFAVDSVPAAFSITRSRFVLYSSNALAILGLRALYLLLAHVITGFRYLHYGLAAVLAFAAVKIVIDSWVHISALASVGFIVVVIGVAIWASLRARKKDERPV